MGENYEKSFFIQLFHEKINLVFIYLNKYKQT